MRATGQARGGGGSAVVISRSQKRIVPEAQARAARKSCAAPDDSVVQGTWRMTNPMKTELENFNNIWERENVKTMKLLEYLPVDGYYFRPDPEGRSLCEMSLTLAEPSAFGSFVIEY